ncbi:MAG: hypothetical protein LBH59_09765 [Planctomycetaceae bacterium]|nr:hypothetical protein [Planctomycetaceae bacterium]
MNFCNGDIGYFFQRVVICLVFILFLLFFICSVCYGAIGDCLWGGSNEETTYTTPFSQSGMPLAQANQPPMNIGAPVPSIPVQATPATRSTLVPQANIPTISPITGNVGTIGQPATTITTNPQIPSGYQTTTNTSGVEILYVLPSGVVDSDICIDGNPSIPAVAVSVVAAGTPGAIPVTVKNVTAYRRRVEYKMKFAPMKQNTETLVRVIDPRTRRVVRTYCRTDERQVTHLPILHWQEVVGYEAVTVKMATPTRQNYPQNYTPNPNEHRVLYLNQTENQYFSTEIN